jgi:hypothetical protein
LQKEFTKKEKGRESGVGSRGAGQNTGILLPPCGIRMTATGAGAGAVAQALVACGPCVRRQKNGAGSSGTLEAIAFAIDQSQFVQSFNFPEDLTPGRQVVPPSPQGEGDNFRGNVCLRHLWLQTPGTSACANNLGAEK